jgi:hypothetical protein
VAYKSRTLWMLHFFLQPHALPLLLLYTMRLSLISALVFSLGFVSQTYAATPALTVHINNKSDYCFILPKQRQTIGDAERPNGMRSYCTSPTGGQGSLPAGMFTKGGPHIKTGMGRGKYKQITGCFNPKKVPTLIPSDGGGQVDSNGGAGGRGNPANSACAGCEFIVLLQYFPLSDALSLSLISNRCRLCLFNRARYRSHLPTMLHEFGRLPYQPRH